MNDEYNFKAINNEHYAINMLLDMSNEIDQ